MIERMYRDGVVFCSIIAVPGSRSLFCHVLYFLLLQFDRLLSLNERSSPIISHPRSTFNTDYEEGAFSAQLAAAATGIYIVARSAKQETEESSFDDRHSSRLFTSCSWIAAVHT